MYAYGTGIFSLASSFVDLYVKKYHVDPDG
jgi:hypothetical protein